MADEEVPEFEPPTVYIPVFWNWNFHTVMGKAEITEDGAIKIKIKPTEDTQTMYQMALRNGLRSFSLSFTADMSKATEEEIDNITQEKPDGTDH